MFSIRLWARNCFRRRTGYRAEDRRGSGRTLWTSKISSCVLFCAFGYEPSKIPPGCGNFWEDSYDNVTILRWLETFWNFSPNSSTLSCLPDGLRWGTVTFPHLRLEMPAMRVWLCGWRIWKYFADGYAVEIKVRLGIGELQMASQEQRRQRM